MYSRDSTIMNIGQVCVDPISWSKMAAAAAKTGFLGNYGLPGGLRDCISLTIPFE